MQRLQGCHSLLNFMICSSSVRVVGVLVVGDVCINALGSGSCVLISHTTHLIFRRLLCFCRCAVLVCQIQIVCAWCYHEMTSLWKPERHLCRESWRGQMVGVAPRPLMPWMLLLHWRRHTEFLWARTFRYWTWDWFLTLDSSVKGIVQYPDLVSSVVKYLAPLRTDIDSSMFAIWYVMGVVIFV